MQALPGDCLCPSCAWFNYGRQVMETSAHTALFASSGEVAHAPDHAGIVARQEGAQHGWKVYTLPLQLLAAARFTALVLSCPVVQELARFGSNTPPHVEPLNAEALKETVYSAPYDGTEEGTPWATPQSMLDVIKATNAAMALPAITRGEDEILQLSETGADGRLVDVAAGGVWALDQMPSGAIGLQFNSAAAVTDICTGLYKTVWDRRRWDKVETVLQDGHFASQTMERDRPDDDEELDRHIAMEAICNNVLLQVWHPPG